MTPRKKMLVAAVSLAVLAVFGGVALASGDDSAEGLDVVSGDEKIGEDAADLPEAVVDEDDGGEDAAEDQSEGPDVALTGDPLAKASATALEVVQQELGQGGRVTATEVGDEESEYEVEVALEDGRQVDVQLDENFDFVGFD